MVKLFSKNSNLCDHNPPTSQTERQTDRQTTCDGNTALCTKVHRAVKTSVYNTVNGKCALFHTSKTAKMIKVILLSSTSTF